MNIAIVGAGNVGTGLAAAAVGAGHAVVVSASNGWTWQSAFALVGPQTAAA